MGSKIAIISLDNFITEINTTSIKADLFEKDSGFWTKLNSCYVNFDAQNIADARIGVKSFADCLGDCRIAAGPEISGVLYHELDSRGFSIFEISSLNPDMLDGVLADIQEAEISALDTKKVPLYPLETETPGVFFLDLLRLQSAHPEISSKQALADFLDHQPFYALRLTCAHIPPWLEKGAYDISTENITYGAISVVVRNKQCGGA